MDINTSDSNKEHGSEISELNKGSSINSCKNVYFENENKTLKMKISDVEEERNATSNQAITLENKLKGNFVSKNVVNLSKWNLNDVGISPLPKRLNFVLTSNNTDKATLKMELEAFGRMLCLKWHFRNKNSYKWI